MKIKKSPVFIISIFLASSGVWSEPAAGASSSVLGLQAEAPRSIIATELGSADVELFAQGYWEALLASSGTFSFGSASAPRFNPVPLFFQQRPDLYVLLTLQKRWWAEASVTDDLARTIFALGYSGAEDDFLKEIRLGNSGISMRDYGSLAFGETKNAFGAIARAWDADKGITADAMIRWDGLAYSTKRFIGPRELEETTFPVANWLHGRKFALPETPISSIALREVVNETSRILGSEEYALSNARGVLELASKPAGILYADYVANGVAYSIELFRKNGSNPYEVKNLYAVPPDTSISAYFLRSRNTLMRDLGYSLRMIAPGLLEITKGEAPAVSTDAFQRPFLESDPWLYDPLPEDSESAYPQTASLELAFRTLKESTGIQIEQDAAIGSVSVYRNGVESVLFTYNPVNGSVELTPPPASGEEIVVRYALNSSAQGGNGLAFGFGVGWRAANSSDWQAGLGGRWPSPGQGFAESGIQHPSWLGLSVAARSIDDKAANFLWSGSIFSRLVRPEASGIYRIAGMEDSLGYKAPFRPISGDTLSSGCESAVDPSFALAWPELDSKIHVTGEKASSLRVAALLSSGTDTRFVSYAEPVPLSLYKKLAFFLRNESVTSASTMDLHVGDGTSGVTIRNLPLQEIKNEWTRVEVSIDSFPVISATDPHGNSVPLSGVSVSYTPLSTAGLVYFELHDLTDGIFWLDEIHLEDPYTGFNSQLKAATLLRSSSAPDDVFVKANANATLNADESDSWELLLNSDIGAGFLTGPAAWRINVLPLLLPGGFDFGASYSWSFPRSDFPLRLGEYFFRQSSNSIFAHKLQASLSLSPLQVELSQENLDSNYLFSQSWSGQLAYSGWASVKLILKNQLPFSVFARSSIPATWLESWSLLLPSREAEASKRQTLAEFNFGPESSLAITANQTFEQNARSLSSLSGRLSLALKIKAIKFKPYYERAITLHEDIAALSLREDMSAWLVAMKGTWPLAVEYPYAELSKVPLLDNFITVSASYEKADYISGPGIFFERPVGYGAWDLWLPSRAQASVSRTLQKNLDSYSDALIFGFKVNGTAFNVFTASGLKPVFNVYDIDEYFWQLESKVKRFAEDGRIFPFASGEYTVSLLEDGQGSSLSGRVQGKFEKTRESTAWSAGFSVIDSIKLEKSWLGDFISLTQKKESEKRNPKPSSNVNVVWSWFDALALEQPILRDIWSAELKCGYSDKETLPLKIQFSQRGETKYSIAKSLSLSVFASLSETLRIGAAGNLWGFGYELGISARVSF